MVGGEIKMDVNESAKVLELQWKKITECSSVEAKQKEVNGLLAWFLVHYSSYGELERKKLLDLRLMKQLANLVSLEFMKAVDLQCSKCGENVGLLIDFLKQGDGVILLLTLVILSDKVTSCSEDLCKLLISILPLCLKECKKKESLEEAAVSCADLLLNVRAFNAWRESLKNNFILGHQSFTASDQNTNSSTLDINSISLDEERLFYSVFVALLNIGLSNSVSKEYGTQQYMMKEIFSFAFPDTLKDVGDELCRHSYLGNCFIVLTFASILNFPACNWDSDYVLNSRSFIINCIQMASKALQFKAHVAHSELWRIEIPAEVLSACLFLLFLGSNPRDSITKYSAVAEVVRDTGIYETMLQLLLVVDRIIVEHRSNKERPIDDQARVDNHFGDIQEKKKLGQSIHQCVSASLAKLSYVLVKVTDRLKRNRKPNHTSNISVERTRTSKLRHTSSRRLHRSDSRKKVINNKEVSREHDKDKGTISSGDGNHSTSSAGDISDYITNFDDSAEIEAAEIRRSSSKRTESREEVQGGVSDSCPISLICRTLCLAYQGSMCVVTEDFILDTLNAVDFCECMDPVFVVGLLLSRLETRCPSVRSKALNLIGQVFKEDTSMLGILLSANTRVYPPLAEKKDTENTSDDIGTQDSGLWYSGLEDCPVAEVETNSLDAIFSSYRNYMYYNDILQEELAHHLRDIVPCIEVKLRREILNKIVLPYLLYSKSCSFEKDTIKLGYYNTQSIYSCFQMLPYLLQFTDGLRSFMDYDGLSCLTFSLTDKRFCQVSLYVLNWLISDKDLTRSIYLERSVRQKQGKDRQSASNRGKQKLKLLDEIRSKAIDIVTSSSDKQFDVFSANAFEKFDKLEDTDIFAMHLCACNGMLQNSIDFLDHFTAASWPEKAFTLWNRITALWQAGVATMENNERSLLSLLKGVLPIVLWFSGKDDSSNQNKPTSRENILSSVDATFLSDQAFRSHAVKDIFSSLFGCTLEETIRPLDILENQENKFTPEVFKAETAGDEDDDTLSEVGHEEEGYDADSETESERNYFSRTPRFSKAAIANDDIPISEIETSDKPLIIHPDLLLMVLRSCSLHFERGFQSSDDEETKRLINIMQHCFEILLSHMKGNRRNCELLCQQGLFLLLVTKFKVLFEALGKIAHETQEYIRKILVLLSSQKVSGNELREFLQLFKMDNPATGYLTKILMDMAIVSYASYGSVHSLSFPSIINESIQKDRANVPSLHKAHSFLVPRRFSTQQGRSVIRYRSVSWANKVDIAEQELTPLHSELHPSAWEIALVQLSLDGKFTWPDREFSLSIWFQIDDKSISFCNMKSHGQRYTHSCPELSTRRFKSSKDFGLSSLFHICSFGSINTLFEVWLGSRSGHLEYRWIVSDNKRNEEVLSCFDQVLVHSSFSINKWHHLFISIVLPQKQSQPHSAEVLTFLDGCKQTTVQVKFPSQKVSSQSKLHALLGHGLRTEKEIRTNNAIQLKTGNFMVFTGAESFTNPQWIMRPAARKPNSTAACRDEAIFLYALGPNDSLMSGNPHSYLASQAMRHMDSSLNWESMLFRDMSFSLGILSEHLVAASFPIHLLTDTSKHAPFIQSSLQDCLLLTYSPQQFTEFTQYTFSNSTISRFSRSIDDLRNGQSRQPKKVLATLCSDVSPCKHETLQQAVHDVGGMSVLLFLLARVAESHDSGNAVACILNAIFCVQERCPYLLREMNDLAGYILIQRVLHSSPCEIGFYLLQVLITSMCDGEVFLSNDACSTEAVNPYSTAIVKNVCILQVLVLDWKLWDRAPVALQEVLWKSLEVLIRPSHPHVAFNLVQFQRVRVIDRILTGCQERQQEKVAPLPKSVSTLYIDIVSHMLGQPPDMSVLKAVISFLIAVHPTLDALKLDSPGSFYLIQRASDPVGSTAERSATIKTLKESGLNMHTRSHSFTEGFSGPEKSLTRSESNDSIISILVSEGGTSPDDKGLNTFLPKFPKTEVLFHKRHRYPCATPADAHNDVDCSVPNGVHSYGDDKTGRVPLRGPSQSTPRGKDTNNSENDDDRKSLSSINSDMDLSAVNHPKNSPDLTKRSIRKKSGSRLSKNVHRRNRSLDVNLRLMVGNQSTPLDSQEYDIISDSELPSSLEHHEAEEFLVVDGMTELKVSSFTPSRGTSPSSEEINMLYHLRLGLLELLQRVITFLPDHMVPRVSGTILKVEHLLVLVSQEEEILREVAVKNLSLYLQRGGQDCLDNFKRFMGFHLLANQLHQHRATIGIANSCFGLLTGNDENQKAILTTHCPDAIVACLSLLEMSVLDPPVCHLLVDVIIKAFSSIDNLPIVAFDYGMAGLFINAVKCLVAADNYSLSSPWKFDVFGDLLYLGSWIVKKACCTCQTLYFQMYKDLILLLSRLEFEEREKKGSKSDRVIRTARFLQYYFVQVALNIFRTSDLYTSYSRLGKKGVMSSTPESTDMPEHVLPAPKRSSSVAKAIFQRIRASIVQPTIATPAELQERFQYICNEAVNLICLFSKRGRASDNCLYGHTLNDLSTTPILGDVDEVDANFEPLGNGDKQFRQGILSFMLDAVCLCLDQSTAVSSWTSLLKATKESVLSQTNRLVSYLISPLNNHDVRLSTVQAILRRNKFKNIVQGLQHSSLGAKNRDRLLMCLHNVLTIPQDELYVHHRDILHEAKELLKVSKVDLIDSPEQQLWQEMHEIKMHRRQRERDRQKEAYERLKGKYNSLCSRIISHGLGVSQVLVDEQDRQRQKLLRYVRGTFSKHVEVKKVWRNLIHHLVQERSPWFVPGAYPASWQLDPTEGPSRIRKRLQRCHLDVPSRFLMPKHRDLHESVDHFGGILSYLFEEEISGDKSTYYHFKTNDTIRFLYHCVRVTPAANTTGEVLIGETHMYFVGEEILTDNNITQVAFGDKDVISISWRYEEISEILKRRYSLQDNALEIFLTSGRTFLLSFENKKNRDEVFDQLMSRELPNLVTNSIDLSTLAGRWRDGLITNFEYLTELNKKAGRSFNDLMQYPVFPFVLADYSSEQISLLEASTFRDLSKPIAVQHPSKEEKYQETYDWLNFEYERKKVEDPESATPPYHYGSHYSNSGTVLHFLVRLPPFTSMFLKYQDNQFDIPDRTFHSMSTTWHLSSYASSSDVKELIPEFFFLEEFLENNEGFDFGRRQNGVHVDNVTLPAWAKGSARLFTLVHRQALESDYVSTRLNNWIDLVFGCKQTGQSAIKAFNVFHPATYFGVDVNAITDAIKRRATQTMIETYGQTPCQLFTQAHVQRFSKSGLPNLVDVLPLGVEAMMFSGSFKEKSSSSTDSKPQSVSPPLPTVSGLKWGNYCGSPTLPNPVVQWLETARAPIWSVITSTEGLLAFLLPQSTSLILAAGGFRDNRHIGCIQWGRGDGLLRVKSVNGTKHGFFDPLRPDQVTCCAFVPEAEVLLIGGSSGVLSAWPVRYNHDVPSLDGFGAKQNLLGHTGAITNICVCQAYSVIVTASEDRTAIIWDLNRLCYVRSLPEHPALVQCLTVDKRSGDIATSCSSGSNQGHLFLWTINSKPIGDVTTDATITCLGFSGAQEGISVNVIAAGLDDGTIRLWSTWTLDLLRSFSSTQCPYPVISLAFSEWDPRHLFSCDIRGNVLLWTPKDFSLPKPATYVPLLD